MGTPASVIAFRLRARNGRKQYRVVHDEVDLEEFLRATRFLRGDDDIECALQNLLDHLIALHRAKLKLE
jgi:hypothetical protein